MSGDDVDRDGSGGAVSTAGVAQVSKTASAATCSAAEMAASQGRSAECGERSGVNAGASRAGRMAAISNPLRREASDKPRTRPGRL